MLARSRGGTVAIRKSVLSNSVLDQLALHKLKHVTILPIVAYSCDFAYGELFGLGQRNFRKIRGRIAGSTFCSDKSLFTYFFGMKMEGGRSTRVTCEFKYLFHYLEPARQK